MEVFNTIIKSGSNYIEILGVNYYFDLCMDGIKTGLYNGTVMFINLVEFLVELDQETWTGLIFVYLIIWIIVQKFKLSNNKKIINKQQSDILILRTKLYYSYYEANKMTNKTDKIIHSYEEILKERDIKIIMLINQLNNNPSKVASDVVDDNGIAMVDKYTNTVKDENNIKLSVNLQENKNTIKLLQEQLAEKDNQYNILFDQITDKQEKLNDIEKHFNLIRDKQ